MKSTPVTLQTTLYREAVGDIPCEIRGNYIAGIPEHVWSGAPQPGEGAEIDGILCVVTRDTADFERGEIIRLTGEEEEHFCENLIEKAERR